MSFLRNTSWSAAGNITNAVGRMTITVILARRLGPDSFGLFVFVQWLIDMAFLVFSVGLTGVATRFFPQSAGDGQDRLPGFNRWFLRAAGLAVLLASCYATLASLAFSNLSSVTSVTVVTFWASTYSLWALLGARAQGLFQFKRYAVSISVFIGVALVGLTLPRPEGDLLGSMVVLASANLVAATVCAADLFNREDHFSNDPLTTTHLKLIRPYATNAWLTSIVASLVWARGEISLVKGHLGESAVGVYSVGLTLSGLINQGLGLLTGALWPQIARAWDKEEREKLLRFYSLITNLLMLIAALSSGFVICFAPYIISLLFGEAFLQSSKLVLLLALGPLGLASGCAHLIVQAATNGRFARDVTIAGGVVLFGASFALIPRFGIEGAAAARSAVQIGVGVLTFMKLEKVLGHSAGRRLNLSFVLLVALAASLALLLIEAPELQLWWLFVLFSVYCCFVCLICWRNWEPHMLAELRALSGATDA